ncbi:MAG: beta-propeller fold lactonase family protein [Bacteroidetes bacterium]|nr:beta-propeller fold lactonase family protein [Bacteroidota bacterium]
MRTLLSLCCAIVMTAVGCKQEATVDPLVDAVGIVESAYGVAYSNSAAIGWSVDAGSVDRVSVYRHMTALFSRSSALQIAVITDSMQHSVVDSGLVNGTEYFYTIVPEKQDAEGGIVQGLGTKRISLTPYDPTVLTAGTIVYSQHIQPIFSTGCAVSGCHSGASHAKAGRTLHGSTSLDLSSWTSAIAGTDPVAQIVPFRSSKSHIIQHLNSDTLVAPVASPSMPPGIRFPSTVRDLLRRWIDAGAKNDDGTVAYSAAPVRGWAYVTNQGEDLTAVIDLDRNRIARYVTTGLASVGTASPQAPHNAVVDWQNQYYYVNLIGGSKLLKFRVSDNTLAGELTSGLSSPAQVALTKNSDTAFVTNFENGKTNITVVNTVTMTKIGDIGSPAMLKPHGVTITPDFRSVIVANSLSDNITVINTSDRSIAAVIPVSGSVPALPVNYTYQFEPYQSVITPDSRFVFVTCRKSGEVRVIDLQLGTVIDSITVGTFPLIPAITPAGDIVFVANRNSNSVTAVSVATRSVLFTVPNVGVEPHGIAVSKDGKYVYVSCENLGVSEPPHHATSGGKKPSFLKVIDIASRSVIASLELGNFGSGMAVTN